MDTGLEVWTGSNFVQLKGDSFGRLTVAQGGATQWSVTSAPAVNNLAVASKAAGATGVKHVCSGISFSWANDGTANGTARSLVVTLRDGATGAGTILYNWPVRITTTATDQNNFGRVDLSGLNLLGTAATAMTLEFTGTAPDHTFLAANITGYDTT